MWKLIAGVPALPKEMKAEHVLTRNILLPFNIPSIKGNARTILKLECYHLSDELMFDRRAHLIGLVTHQSEK